MSDAVGPSARTYRFGGNIAVILVPALLGLAAAIWGAVEVEDGLAIWVAVIGVALLAPLLLHMAVTKVICAERGVTVNRALGGRLHLPWSRIVEIRSEPLTPKEDVITAFWLDGDSVRAIPLPYTTEKALGGTYALQAELAFLRDLWAGRRGPDWVGAQGGVEEAVVVALELRDARIRRLRAVVMVLAIIGGIAFAVWTS